jgi:hypothetical protein
MSPPDAANLVVVVVVVVGVVGVVGGAVEGAIVACKRRGWRNNRSTGQTDAATLHKAAVCRSARAPMPERRYAPSSRHPALSTSKDLPTTIRYAMESDTVVQPTEGQNVRQFRRGIFADLSRNVRGIHAWRA